MMTSANICHHFEFFFNETKDSMLVIIHAKFEVNKYCGWDFRQRGKFTPPPPLCTNANIDTPCTIGLKSFNEGIFISKQKSNEICI